MYDLCVIGGGPAGIIVAGFAGKQGLKTILLEKNISLGKKLLISGKGRCNITNATFDLHELVNAYGKNGKFLYSAFSKFSVQNTINFFENLGVKTKIERGNRVFPISDSAREVLSALEKFLRDEGVDIRFNSEVKKIIKEGNSISKVVLSDGSEILSNNYVIATGGLSYPALGSTGDGYKWARELGHTVVKPEPALNGMISNEKFIRDLTGLSLKNVNISILLDNKKKDERFGEALFTHVGISGPIILDMSKSIGMFLKKGKVELSIDFKPALSEKELDARILQDFLKNKNKMFRNSLDDLLPAKLRPVIVDLSRIHSDKQVNEITKEERKSLARLLKDFRLNIIKTEGFEKAIVTSGGVSLKEIDPKTMKSKIIDNLYFAGEVIDIDGPTGGYNLQMCWSTGYLAINNK